MSEGTKWHESRICGCCGKTFSVFYPDLWRYKRGDKVLSYFCSWSCLRKFDKEQEGKDDLNMSGRTKKDGTPAKRPGPKPKKIEIPEEVPVLKVDGALKIETPEAARVDVAEVPEGKIGGLCPPPDEYEHRYTAVETTAGDFQYFRKNGYLDWTPLDRSGGTISLSIEEWREFFRVFPLMAKDLGVEM